MVYRIVRKTTSVNSVWNAHTANGLFLAKCYR